MFAFCRCELLSIWCVMGVSWILYVKGLGVFVWLVLGLLLSVCSVVDVGGDEWCAVCVISLGVVFYGGVLIYPGFSLQGFMWLCDMVMCWVVLCCVFVVVFMFSRVFFVVFWFVSV